MIIIDRQSRHITTFLHRQRTISIIVVIIYNIPKHRIGEMFLVDGNRVRQAGCLPLDSPKTGPKEQPGKQASAKQAGSL